METGRKFTFKLPGSNSNNNQNVNTSSEVKPVVPVKSIPFSLKNFTNTSSGSSTTTSSIFNYTNTSTKPAKNNNKEDEEAKFVKKPFQKSNSNNNDEPPPSKPSIFSQKKETNNKMVKSIVAQSTLTNFIATNKSATSSFKKPNLSNNTNGGSILSNLKDETDDDWDMLEKKVKSPKPPLASNKNMNTKTNEEDSKTALLSALAASTTANSKTKLNFKSPAKPGRENQFASTNNGSNEKPTIAKKISQM
jgi:hypothetical protein